jgi:hypothetical protein
MTQAFNLSQLANNLNTSGQLDATDGLTGAVPVANGGTGLTATPSNGQIDIGNGSGFSRTTITAGSGISVTNGSGSITIASSGGGVTSFNDNTGALAGYQLITSGTVSSGSTAINIGSLPSGYKTFRILYDLGLSTAGTVMNHGLRVSTNGGSTYISTNNYYYNVQEMYNGGINSQEATSLQSNMTVGRPVWTNPGGSVYFLMSIDIIQSTNSSFLGVIGETTSVNTNGAGLNSIFGGWYNQTTYVNGIQLVRTSSSMTYNNGGYIVYGAK